MRCAIVMRYAMRYAVRYAVPHLLLRARHPGPQRLQLGRPLLGLLGRVLPRLLRLRRRCDLCLQRLTQLHELLLPSRLGLVPSRLSLLPCRRRLGPCRLRLRLGRRLRRL